MLDLIQAFEQVDRKADCIPAESGRDAAVGIHRSLHGQVDSGQFAH
jgi:hypothetical protein